MRNVFVLVALWAVPALAAQELHFDGGVPDDEGRYFEVPFIVPAGTREIEVHHDDLEPANILDWGLEDPNGFRGYGGGNEEPAIVGEEATSRSYLRGPLPPGEWKVLVGKAKINKRPAFYKIDIELRTEPTLAAQPERMSYTPSPPLEMTARWYAGDFHVHSLESGDARPTLDEIATFARSQGLDFVFVTDHSTVSQLDFIPSAQARHGDLLLGPGMELTTYWGHINAFGITGFVEPWLGFQGRTIEGAVAQYQAMGALLSINHPAMDLPMDMCIGCAWKLPVPPQIDAVEIGTGGWNEVGMLFSEPAIAFWDTLSATGIHAKALGGSDDHRAGIGLNGTQSPIGSPTTLVFAQELSVDALLSGIRDGRTVVKLAGPDDPMIDFDAAGRIGDTVTAASARLVARVTGGAGDVVRLVRNGKVYSSAVVPTGDFAYEVDVGGRDTADRWRAEVLVGGRVRTITSNIWLQKTAGAAPSPYEGAAPALPACGCSSPGAGSLPSLALIALLVARSWRRARARRTRTPARTSPAPGCRSCCGGAA